MRVIAGRWRCRQLEAPPGLAIRPTADRAREAIFNVFEHGRPPLRGARFLDLFAGTGAAGIEALSRGAAFVTFIERGAQALAAIRRNLASLAGGNGFEIIAGDATRLGCARAAADLVFMDPPYGSGLAAASLRSLLEGGWLAPDAMIAVELGRGEVLLAPSPVVPVDERRYGAARMVILRHPARYSS